MDDRGGRSSSRSQAARVRHYQGGHEVRGDVGKPRFKHTLNMYALTTCNPYGEFAAMLLCLYEIILRLNSE